MGYGTPLYKRRGSIVEAYASSATVGYPSGIAAGDMLILTVSYKSQTVSNPTISSVTGSWTSPTDSHYSAGLGAQNYNSGAVAGTLYYKIATGSESGLETITFSGSVGYIAVISLITKPVDSEWVTPTCSAGAHITGSTTSWNTWNSANTTYTPPGRIRYNEVNDLVLAFTATNDDAYTRSNHQILADGMGFTTAKEEVEYNGGYGYYQALILATARASWINPGLADGEQWYQMTSSGSTTVAAAGITILCNLRVAMWQGILKRRTGSSTWKRARAKRRIGGSWTEINNGATASGKFLKRRIGGTWNKVSCISISPATRTVNLTNAGYSTESYALDITTGNQLDLGVSQAWLYATSYSHNHSDVSISAAANTPGNAARDASVYLQVDGTMYDQVSVYQAAGETPYVNITSPASVNVREYGGGPYDHDTCQGDIYVSANIAWAPYTTGQYSAVVNVSGPFYDDISHANNNYDGWFSASGKSTGYTSFLGGSGGLQAEGSGYSGIIYGNIQSGCP